MYTAPSACLSRATRRWRVPNPRAIEVSVVAVGPSPAIARFAAWVTPLTHLPCLHLWCPRYPRSPGLILRFTFALVYLLVAVTVLFRTLLLLAPWYPLYMFSGRQMSMPGQLVSIEN